MLILFSCGAVLTNLFDVQVIKTFKIRDLFREAINACPDIDEVSFPYLYKNKALNSKSGNVLKLTTNAFRRLMIFIARLYQARIVMSKIGDRQSRIVPDFNFENFPLMKEVFICIEKHLDKVLTSQDKKVGKQSVSILFEDIQKDISFWKRNHDVAGARIDGIKDKLDHLEKKVTALEKKKDKKRSHSPELVPFTKDERKRIKQMLKTKKTKKRKKKGKKRSK